MNIILKNSILFFLLLGCSQSSANMETALTTAANTGTAVTLEQITDFEWDKVYVIGPYDQFDYSHISHVPAGVRKVIERQIIEERNALLTIHSLSYTISVSVLLISWE